MNMIETSRLILNEPAQHDVVCVSGLWKNEIVRTFLGEVISEAHCYLKFNDQILDVTFPGEVKLKLDFDILDEQEILPQNIHLKPFNHKEKLKEWLKDNPFYPLQDIDLLWQIREHCIQAAPHQGKYDNK